MFDSIRKRQRLLLFFVLLLIFPAFVFFGVSGYESFMSEDDAVARVGDQKVSRAQFDDALRRQLENMQRVFGGTLDARQLDTPEARRQLLEGLIAERALLLEAADKRVVITDAQLREEIANTPGLRTPEGAFDMERYRTLLAAQGMSEAMFEARYRNDLAVQAIPGSIARSTMVPDAVLDRIVALDTEVRDVRALHFRPRDFTDKVELDDAKLQAFYDANPSLFERPESASIEYLVLDVDTVASGIELAEADLRTYYEQNQQRFGMPERRQARHILIQPASDSESDRAAARSEAEQLVAQLRSAPDRFAELAREHSDDPGSAQQGGDLGLFERDAMVEPFADAAFALEQGAISDVVQTEFGFHVIQVTAIEPARVQPFDEARAAIAAEIRQQQARSRFAELAERFANTVYEQPDSLEPAARALGLELRRIEQYTRSGVDTLPAGAPINQPRVVAAVFGAEAIERKLNTEAIEVAPNTLVSARVLEHRPAAVRPFAEVKDLVRERVIEQESERLAREAGTSRLEALRAGGSLAGFGEAFAVSRARPGELARPALDAIMRLAADSLPAFTSVELGEEGYAVYHVLGASPASDQVVAERRTLVRQAIQRAVARIESDAYIESLKSRSEVERYESRLLGDLQSRE